MLCVENRETIGIWFAVSIIAKVRDSLQVKKKA